MGKVRILIDADIPFFSAVSICERDDVVWSDGVTSTGTSIPSTRQQFFDTLKAWVETTTDSLIVADMGPVHEVVLCFSDFSRKNFRKRLYSQYKLSRKKKSSLWESANKDIYEYFHDTGSAQHSLTTKKRRAALAEFLEVPIVRVVYEEWMEADDVMGILGDISIQARMRPVYVSTDKDMATLSGYWVDPSSGALMKTHPRMGALIHLIQTLTGDVVDNYPGAPGVGPVGALKTLLPVLAPEGVSSSDILQLARDFSVRGGDAYETVEGWVTCLTDQQWNLAYWNLWRDVVRVFTYKGRDESDALLQARMAFILDDADFLTPDSCLPLWSPPTEYLLLDPPT